MGWAKKLPAGHGWGPLGPGRGPIRAGGGEALAGAKTPAAAGVLLLGARALTVSGAGEALAARLGEVLGGRMVTASLELELGPRESAAAESASPEPELSFSFSPSPEPGASPEPSPEPEEAAPESSANIVETTIYSGLSIKNSTSYEIDVGELVRLGPTQVLPSEGPQVLIVHTHGSEAYTPDRLHMYEASDSYRTEDKELNVIRVGDELAAALEEQGLTVLHDREIYDYPSYTGSYNRSGAAVEAYLAEYPDIAVVIDLHRDALGGDDVVYKTMAELDGQASSQLMMLVGTGEGGLSHPNWEQNLRLALYLQQAVNAKYPTLARPVTVTQERYNQHLTTGSMILEVGSSGNTLPEALTAVRLYADAVGPALLKLVAEN